MNAGLGEHLDLEGLVNRKGLVNHLGRCVLVDLLYPQNLEGLVDQLVPVFLLDPADHWDLRDLLIHGIPEDLRYPGDLVDLDPLGVPSFLSLRDSHWDLGLLRNLVLHLSR